MTSINEDKKAVWAAAGYTGTYNDMEAAFYIDNPKGTDQEYFDFLRGEGYTGTINDMEKDYYVNGSPGTAVDDNFASVIALLGFEGADTSTTITDESPLVLTWAASGQAQIDTAQFKFDTSSLIVDGAGDFVSTVDAASVELASGDFTIEGSFRWTADPAGYQGLIGKWATSNKSYAIMLNGAANKLELFLSSNGGTSIIKITEAWTPTLDTWYTIAADWDGTTYRLYVDGAVLGTATTAVALFDGTASLSVGSVDSNEFNGHVDEVRVTKGVARYAGAYTPATSAFPRSA